MLTNVLTKEQYSDILDFVDITKMFVLYCFSFHWNIFFERIDGFQLKRFNS